MVFRGLFMTRFVLKDSVFYHGTYRDFEKFKPLSHFGSLQAAKRILSLGPKIEVISDFNEIYFDNTNLDFTDLSEQSKIIPVKLNINNTYELQDIHALHDMSFYKNMLLYHFMYDMRLSRVPKLYDYIAFQPFNKMKLKDVVKELLSDSLYKPDKSVFFDVVNRQNLFFQRMIQYFESIGIDGFHYTNNYEDKGHISYVPFRPENIIRQDIKLPIQKYNIKPAKNIDDFGFRDCLQKELFAINIEASYWYNVANNKKMLLDTRKDIFLCPSHLKQLIEQKVYYSNLFFKEVLPKIEQVSYQPEYGYHGLSHTSQVAMFGLDIALSVNQDPLPVLLAAGLHDCARTNDDYCEKHGPNCEPIARKFLSENYDYLLPSVKERIIDAVKKHTTGMRTVDLVSACLWDADRIRLSWEMGYEPKFFSTPYAKNIASLTKPQQDKYIKKQEDFLVAHNIKTRRQIEYEKIMDACCNACGTVFKVR